MRTLAAALSIALLAACSSSDSPPPATFGGFAPQAQTAVIFAPRTCTLPVVGPTSVSGVAIAFTSFADPCAVLQDTLFCGTEASSSAILAVALSGLVGGGTVGDTGPGTYPYLANPPTTSSFRASLGDGAMVDASCASVAGGSLDMAGGQIVLASVDGAGVTGSVDLRFDDGSAFQHAIDATVCPMTYDVCDLFVPCYPHQCVPAP